ncbi:DUF309 domain-containing protein [Psychrobacillus lasiicapitis]|uniref:DUF309 domain-containing protein n=2 Tax=Psychrobacillus TaxID=1221880 RepID=A0A544THT1_9BACI|nr:DUF309 domain-containing protein [Psychrobacillus lasiicapitis]TQR17006.1 DUF309 domain-containing protein [Psychrobacillus lasiicapitis]GGA25342.1 hypothetical protein GCM10011384_13180 [Psychrobacillus lasiicapitis]
MITLHPTFHPNFVQFIKEFNGTKDYFECHELLEDYWKEVSQARKNHPLTAFILLSTSMYHWRRGNITGAIKTMNGSIKRFVETSPSVYYDTINYTKLMQDTTHSISLLKEKKAFQQFTIELMNEQLERLVDALGITTEEDLHFLTHKHMLRDRSEILIERERQKKRRDDLK